MTPAPLEHRLRGLPDRSRQALFRQFLSLLCLACATLLLPTANSSVVIGGTRVIYPDTEREVTLRLTNEGSQPALVQAWIDDGFLDSSPEDVDVPFMVTPPLTRINPRMGQALRIVYLPSAKVATDRESVYWMNVLDVPPLPSAQVANTMQLAFRSRIKLFLRPAGLPGDPGEAAQGLRWRIAHTREGVALQVRNDSAFHVSLTAVELTLGGGQTVSIPARMLPPLSVTELGAGAFPSAAGAKGTVVFDWINDHGSTLRRESPLVQ